MVSNKIRETLLYSDLFDYPLTREELYYYLHANRVVSKKDFDAMLESKQGFGSYNNYFFLPGRKQLLVKRQSRITDNEGKIHRAKYAANIIKHIPTVQLIGLSGSVAMRNANRDDDIDFFLITSENSLWLTRFFALLLLSFFGLLRTRNGKRQRNMICMNMIIAENMVSFPHYRQNLYTAHEMMQMKVLYAKKNSYDRLLAANRWVIRYLANAYPQEMSFTGKRHYWTVLIAPIEKIAKAVQSWYMQKHRTREEIREGFLAFHPIPYEKQFLDQFSRRRKGDV
ncbi:MAG TPA: hypothetical protein VGT05_02020 [Patescibacteria group bacterium]|nr:hypothetical protein [Patescibacteria group bacterium]